MFSAVTDGRRVGGALLYIFQFFAGSTVRPNGKLENLKHDGGFLLKNIFHFYFRLPDKGEFFLPTVTRRCSQRVF